MCGRTSIWSSNFIPCNLFSWNPQYTLFSCSHASLSWSRWTNWKNAFEFGMAMSNTAGMLLWVVKWRFRLVRVKCPCGIIFCWIASSTLSFTSGITSLLLVAFGQDFFSRKAKFRITIPVPEGSLFFFAAFLQACSNIFTENVRSVSSVKSRCGVVLVSAWYGGASSGKV